MTRDLSEVYEYIFLPDGRRIVAPSKCITCAEIKEDEPSCMICLFCGHAYYKIAYNTERIHFLQGKCWCYILIRDKMIDKAEDYPDFYKECLIDSLPMIEKIGITCDLCKKKDACEDGGTNVFEIMNIKGYCEDVVL